MIRRRLKLQAPKRRRRTTVTSRENRKEGRGVASLQKFLRAYGTDADGIQARDELAARCSTTYPYLLQIALGFRQASIKMAIRIEKATHGLVPVEDLHPSDDWEYMAKRRRLIVQAQA